MSLLSVSVMARRLAQHDLSVYFANVYFTNIYCVNVYNSRFAEDACFRGAVAHRLPLETTASIQQNDGGSRLIQPSSDAREDERRRHLSTLWQARMFGDVAIFSQTDLPWNH